MVYDNLKNSIVFDECSEKLIWKTRSSVGHHERDMIRYKNRDNEIQAHFSCSFAYKLIFITSAKLQ